MKKWYERQKFLMQQLRLEIIRLRERIDKISTIAAKCISKSVVSCPILSKPVPSQLLGCGVSNSRGPSNMSHNIQDAGDLLRSIRTPNEVNKPLIQDLVVVAMKELLIMAPMGEPLWMTTLDGTTTVLNKDECLRLFPKGINPTFVGFKYEASRETIVVVANAIDIVEILMDANQWMVTFSSIFSEALTIEVLSIGMTGNYDSALQVIKAELQVPSPFVPTRKSYFVRYSKQHMIGTWAVVDVSLENLYLNPYDRCRRRPSGCLIQEMINGYTRVVWVEHMEVDNEEVHDLYKHLVNSSLAFGARCWLATLNHQCERIASSMAMNIPISSVGFSINQTGKKNMLKLAERMFIRFFLGVSASTLQKWTTLSRTGDNNVRLMTQTSMGDLGTPTGIILNATNSFWIPFPHKRVFDFLRDINSRNKGDTLSIRGVVQEIAYIVNGRNTSNCVSLLQVNSNCLSQSSISILQDSCTDRTGSFIIYALVDNVDITEVLNGGNPNHVALLPSGFAILSDGTMLHADDKDETSQGGSLLTVAFQILVDFDRTAKLSFEPIAIANHLVDCTIDKIMAAL